MSPQIRKGLSYVFRALGAVAVTAAMAVAGVELAPLFPSSVGHVLGFVALGILGLLLVLIAASCCAFAVFRKKRSESVQRMQEFYLAQREAACEALPRAVKRLVRLRRMLDACSLLTALVALFLAFAIGVASAQSGDSVGLSIIPVYLLYAIFGRIVPYAEKPDFSGYVSPADYPTLQALAAKAAAASGLSGEIRIFLLSNCNAGIAKIGKTYSLQLGVQLLLALSEEELYCVLLHEFAHLTKDGNPSDREFMTYNAITSRDATVLDQLCNLLFLYPEALFTFEYFVYRIASSIAIEQIADNAILQHGNPQTAANALGKLAFYELFEYEMADFVGEHFFAPEEPRSNAMTVLSDAFRRAVAAREDFWRSLLAKEIEPRTASHPILRRRLQSLGVSDFTVTLPTDYEGAYGEEVLRARDAVEAEFLEAEKEGYAERREQAYLVHVRTVEKWQAANGEVSVEETRAVINALWALDRREELEGFCDHLISTSTNKFATPHAEMTKGQLMLRRYDQGGIEHIWRAIELNKNYVDEGLDAIGHFCCMMGLQEELDHYRERALELGQQQVDEYSGTESLSPRDNLRPDEMPEGMLDGILAYVDSVDVNRAIQRIYVVRKVITEQFFSSVFVVEPKKDAKPEDVDDVMDKIFNHLDTHPADWQFSLFLFDAQTARAVNRVKGSCVLDREAKK